MGGVHAFCLDYPPLEYVLTKPPRSTYVVDNCWAPNCFVLFNVKRARIISTHPFPLHRGRITIDIYIYKVVMKLHKVKILEVS